MVMFPGEVLARVSPVISRLGGPCWFWGGCSGGGRSGGGVAGGGVAAVVTVSVSLQGPWSPSA